MVVIKKILGTTESMVFGRTIEINLMLLDLEFGMLRMNKF
ncbi:hypothetical protein LALCM10_150106 [Dellaglioa algida]|nr:hypothetical protein LALCM10_150106 [Dellaglioa algida]